MTHILLRLTLLHLTNPLDPYKTITTVLYIKYLTNDFILIFIDQTCHLTKIPSRNKLMLNAEQCLVPNHPNLYSFKMMLYIIFSVKVSSILEFQSPFESPVGRGSSKRLSV